VLHGRIRRRRQVDQRFPGYRLLVRCRGREVERVEQERQANVIRAEGEAESAETISRAVDKAGDGLIQIRRIDAAKEIAQTLGNNPNVTYLPGGARGGDGSGGGGANILLGLR